MYVKSAGNGLVEIVLLNRASEIWSIWFFYKLNLDHLRGFLRYDCFLSNSQTVELSKKLIWCKLGLKDYLRHRSKFFHPNIYWPLLCTQHRSWVHHLLGPYNVCRQNDVSCSFEQCPPTSGIVARSRVLGPLFWHCPLTHTNMLTTMEVYVSGRDLSYYPSYLSGWIFCFNRYDMVQGRD